MNIVIKVTKACNLRCSYCYVDHDSTDLMTTSMAKVIIRKFSKSLKHIKFLWHGGEPLLADMNFYKKAFAEAERCAEKNGVVFQNQLQTNGTLLTDDWIEFLAEKNVFFGVSYDGPDDANGYRRDLKGNAIGTKYFENLFAKLKKCPTHTGVLCVVNNLNIKKPKELYLHFKSLKVKSINFSPYLGGREDVEAINCEDYYCFFKTVFDLWMDDDEPFIAITNLNDILYNLFNVHTALSCTWSGSCYRSNLAVLPNGDIFPCLTLKDANHCIGNVLEGTVDNVIRHPNFTKLYLAQKEVFQKCSDCVYLKICRTGCRTAAWRMLGRLNEKDPFCKGRKKLINYVTARLYSMLTGCSSDYANAILIKQGFPELHKDLLNAVSDINPNTITSKLIRDFYKTQLRREEVKE